MSELPLTSRNVEIKASIDNKEEFEKRVQIAAKLTNATAEVLNQHDIFFKTVTAGRRLKLRYQDVGERAMLIEYLRDNVSGPKVSAFDKITLEDPKKLERMLSSCLGRMGEVKKQRLLFMYDKTRIHLDHVEGLGYFLEFEVCLAPTDSVQSGNEIARFLMKELMIDEEHLIEGAYVDALLDGGNQ